MSTPTSPVPLDLSDLDACAGALRYLHTVLTLACAAKAVHESGAEVTVTALADRCEQATPSSGLNELTPQLSEILALPRPAALAHIPDTLRAIARDEVFGPRVNTALARVDYKREKFVIEMESSLIEARDTIFDRLTALLLDATDA